MSEEFLYTTYDQANSTRYLVTVLELSPRNAPEQRPEQVVVIGGLLHAGRVAQTRQHDRLKVWPEHPLIFGKERHTAEHHLKKSQQDLGLHPRLPLQLLGKRTQSS